MMRIGARLIVAACWWAAFAASAAPLDEAQELIDQGRYEQALSLLEREMAAAPNTAEPRFLRGIALAQLGRYDEAIAAFEALTEEFPQLPEPYNNLAVIHAQRGDYQSAREALEAALATHPSYATAHENLGDLYAAMAGAAYNRALMLDEDNPALRGKLALINQMHDAPQTFADVARTPVVPRQGLSPAATAPPARETASVAAPPVPAAAAVAPETALVALQRWAAAWSAQDVDAYLAAYASDFQPDNGLSRATWAAQRRERLRSPRYIRVTVSDAEVTPVSSERLHLRFLQTYESDTYSDQVHKTLELRRENGHWLIVRETAG